MTGIIVSNGNIEDYDFYRKYFKKESLVIAVDGGAFHLRNLGIKPDILLGDFDSILKEDYENYYKAGVEILKFPEEKDATDTEIAIDEGIKRGLRQIILMGVIGSRLDHSLSNVFLLKKILDNGIKGMIVDKYNEIYLIKDRIKIKKEEGYKLSLLPATDKVEGVTTKGLYYGLNDATIEFGSSFGVSNEFISDSAEISIKKGLLLVIKSRD
ncbi:thiamine diphosphokinase [Acetivibrio saccincola]|uniref:Thiamine diphosphokinase n=1 Tax=Acetivibrio saccincola TaxID=1677857 RepID=A0A2S8RBW8_9FIRM|nr:thiamine diphosphokinase [Acetivibrio saccincola]PQQ67286.1 thiamine diphosphokinase [Acetivibrio saccincola]HOA96894.1 thiamine diphosphokinase [Acetivibrio saccincola]HQD28586.1 thiamine diphosphokinase [Acetivibrio saccincola]